MNPGGGAVKQLCAQQGVRLPQPLQPGLGFNAAVWAQLLGTLQSLSYGHLITSFYKKPGRGHFSCTIGGVSTTGGVGTVPGVLVGVLVFELMKVALQFMNVNSSYTYIVQGLVIIVAVAIDIRKYLAKK